MLAYQASVAIQLTRLAEQTQYSVSVESNRNTHEDDNLAQVTSVIVQQKHTIRNYGGNLPSQKLQQVIDYINNHLAFEFEFS